MKSIKIFCIVIFSHLFFAPLTKAQTQINPSNYCQQIKHKKSLTKSAKTTDNYVVTDETISATGITEPSLWWTREQFDLFGNRLINNWRAYPSTKQIYLVVNWQLWTILDYLGRYRFINNFGAVAREYGYELYIINQQQQCLASYQYNPKSNPPKWEINLEQSERDSLQIEPPNY